VNLDDDAHTATGLGFDTGILRPGALQPVTFAESGSFPYSCQIHPMMVGRVEVRGTDGRVAGTDEATPEASPVASPGASPVASPGAREVATVSIADLAFDPPRLEIAAGTTVTWTNDEAIPHTVTSADGTLDSDVLERSDTVSHTFDTAGTFDYACAIHPSMMATVVVKD
ncbi:MAG: cupredoxin domain-containing protein, partial [Chloroflexia bacterium]|nr:cupredoxin domain-containing protein [Chloroflexia bacterium]